jgi:hypothetical protein
MNNSFIASQKSNAAYRGTGCQPVKQIGNLLHGITFLKVNSPEPTATEHVPMEVELT